MTFSADTDLRKFVFYCEPDCNLLYSMSYGILCVLPDIGIMVRVFANGPGDLGSILGRVIPKTQKWYLIPPCLTLSIIRYGSRVKWSNPGKGVAPSPIPWCSSYGKGSLRVTLNYSRQLYLLYAYCWNKNLAKISHFCRCMVTHTHTHTHIYIYNKNE